MKTNGWLLWASRAYAAIGAVFFILAGIAAITGKPLEGTVLPPYKGTIVNVDKFWLFEGGAWDATICGVLGVSGFVGWYIMWYAGRHGRFPGSKAVDEKQPSEAGD